MICTRCEGSGFLNADQFPEGILEQGCDEALAWLQSVKHYIEENGCSCHIRPPCPSCEIANDIQVCDCCGDGDDWYGYPGEHYNHDDPTGRDGPYAYNGGLCECH